MSQPQDFLKQAAEQMQSSLGDQWTQAVQAFQNMDFSAFTANVPGAKSMPKINFAADKLQALQQAYVREASELWNQGLKDSAISDDRRFSGDAWAANPVSAFAAATYLLNSRTLMGLAEAVEADELTKGRIRFSVEQMVAASAPSNFMAFNADAHKKAIDTKGESIAKGMKNLLADMRQGRVSMTDESHFEVGKNVATTEGAVVFENEYFQLIEYKPLTEKVYETPFLMFPAAINKFYILDLQPDNSVIRYSVAQGHRTFIVSWRNPDASMQTRTWDNYIEDAMIKAINVTREICGSKQVNTLGFCVGGTMLSTALAVLAARGDNSVASATFLTVLLDFTDAGVLKLFISDTLVKLKEMQIGKGGLMKGKDMATTFSFLRPNDLVWNYVVGNYLKGETPPPFDLLYWNGDSTNLPGPFFTWYLRNTYLENNLIKHGVVTVCGEKVDYAKVDTPVYIYGSYEDHIVPIDGCYATTQYLHGPKRFVMGASGHIAGVINPPAKKKRSHWVRADGAIPKTHAEWMAGAEEFKGSWWTDWSQWLASQAGNQVDAPQGYGTDKYKVIEPAPGSYVQVKA